MSRPRAVHVGLVQMSCEVDPEANLARAARLVQEAAAQGAQVVCLPEMYRSRYFCQTEDHACFGLAEPLDGPSMQTFARLGAELELTIIVPIFERRAQGLYHNSAFVIDGARGSLGLYRKMHIPDDPRFYEKFYFTPGDLGFRKFQTRHVDLGVLICWDQWYPEAARLTALAGAEVLFYPTAIGWWNGEEPKTNAVQHDAWETIQRSHAVANGIPVVAVNRVGTEGNQIFWGGSFVAGNQGELLFKGSHDKEEVTVVPVDFGRTDTVRMHWPFLRDRRIDAYGDIGKRYIDSAQ